MDFIRKHLTWILIGLAALIVAGIQFLYVSARWEATLEKNKEVADKLGKVSSGAEEKSTRTLGDIGAARKRLAELQGQRVAVERKLYELTGGLNEGMPSGRRVGGMVIHPETNEAIEWDIFGKQLDNLFDKMFEDGEKALAAAMLEKFAVMYADDLHAAERLKTRAEAEVEGRQAAEAGVRQEARILRDPESVKIVKVNLDRFGREDPRKGWAVWRRYLIIRDVLLRAVPGTVVEVSRTLNSCSPADDEERKALKEKHDRGEAVGKEMIEVSCKGWRCVEGIEALKVSDPVAGNREFSAMASPTTAAIPASAPAATPTVAKSPAPASTAAGAAAGDAPVFHDRFTLSLRIVAHLRVVQEFQRKLLESRSIFYVPQSLSVTRFPDDQVMGMRSRVAIRTASKPSEPVAPLAERSSAAERLVAGPDYEPPVLAEMTFDVYRFRYADTDNN